MPWLETDPVIERKRFILEAQGGLFSHAELCRRHGVSRKTGYKWLNRYEAEGPDGLADRSHRPLSCSHATDPRVIEAAIELRRRRPRWGADKIRARVLCLHPDWRLPSAQVLHKYLRREGLVKKRRRSRKRPHPGRPTAPSMRPTASGPPILKVSSKPETGATAIRLLYRTASAATCSRARACLERSTQAPSASSQSSSVSTAYRSGSAPTTDRRSPLSRSAGSRGSPSGGSSSACYPT